MKQRVIPEQRNILVFDRSGKFLNKIGELGRGPGEYIGVDNIFLNHERSSIYVTCFVFLYEYELNGKFIRSFRLPEVNESVSKISYLGNDLFVASTFYNRESKLIHYIFDSNGEVVKYFPPLFHYDRKDVETETRLMSSIPPFSIDRDVYVKDDANDTLYVIANLNLQPTYVFDLGKYAHPSGKKNKKGQIEIMPVESRYATDLYAKISTVTGTPKYLFYELRAPSGVPRPTARPGFFMGMQSPNDVIVHGIYNRATNVNILLDTDQFHQKGLVNDINGGLSFFPKYYAGNGVVADIWQAEDMIEILTQKYFAGIKIKDQESHQKLRDLLRKLDEEDNPVVVVAKLK